MYCNNCGEKLPDNAKFCNQCGVQMGVVLVERIVEKEVPCIDNEEAVNHPQIIEERKGKRKRLAIPEIVLSAILLFVVTFLPLFRFEYKTTQYGDMIFNAHSHYGDTFGIFGVLRENVGLGILCIVAWLFLIAALFLYIRCGQLERFALGFLCLLFIVGIATLIFVQFVDYSVPIPSEGIVKTIRGYSGSEAAYMIMFVMLVISISMMIAVVYEKISIYVHRKMREYRKNKQAINHNQ